MDGPAFGRIALPPSNRAVMGSLGGVVKIGRSGRLSADATYGQWTQDEQFIPFSSNTAITTPFNATSTSSLPAQNLDGRMNVFSLASVFSYRPLQGLGLTARYRRYDLDNPTTRLPVTPTPEDVHIVVAGGRSYFAAVLPGWGGFGGFAVTRPIRRPR